MGIIIDLIAVRNNTKAMHFFCLLSGMKNGRLCFRHLAQQGELKGATQI